MISNLTWRWVGVLALCATFGCGSSSKQPSKSSQGSQDATSVKSEALVELHTKLEELSALPQDSAFAQLLSVQAIVNASLDGEDAIALAVCRCERDFRSEWWASMLESRGALHESLMPEVRMEIRTNGELQELLKMPEGIRDVLKVFFANDTEISDKVRTGVLGKIAVWLRPTFQPVKAAGRFVYDGFARLIDRNVQSTPVSSSFSTMEQAQRWLLIGSALHDGIGLNDTASQVSLMKTLSEWRYLFGLMRDDQNRVIGGLTLDANRPNSNALLPFDPRVQTSYVGMISGDYSVFYPTVQAVDLATSVNEIWTNHRSVTTLKEQALLWEAAAEFYDALRPSQRAVFLKENINQDTIPANAHQLALLWISNLESLLDGPFIDRDARKIYKHANFHGNRSDFTTPDHAELAALVRALSKWTRLLADAAVDMDDPEMQTKMLDGMDSLKNALRLSLQILMSTSEEDTASLERDLEVLATLFVAQRHAIIDSTYFENVIIQKTTNVLKMLELPRSNASVDLRTSFYLRGILMQLSQVDWIEETMRQELLMLSRR